MFRKLNDKIYVAPQIDCAAVEEAAAQGVTLIINNRPEDESADQTPGAEIEAAATAAGLTYVAIPVTHAGFAEWQVTAMAEALDTAEGKVLAFCRSGTRSTPKYVHFVDGYPMTASGKIQKYKLSEMSKEIWLERI